MKLVKAGAIANAAAHASDRGSAPLKNAKAAVPLTPASQSQQAHANKTTRGAAFAGVVTAVCVDTERRLASKSLLNAWGTGCPHRVGLGSGFAISG
jgi:hypothetical protein